MVQHSGQYQGQDIKWIFRETCLPQKSKYSYFLILYSPSCTHARFKKRVFQRDTAPQESSTDFGQNRVRFMSSSTHFLANLAQDNSLNFPNSFFIFRMGILLITQNCPRNKYLAECLAQSNSSINESYFYQYLNVTPTLY